MVAVGTAPRSRRRGVERSALYAFVPVVAMAPFSLLSLLVMWLPVTAISGLGFGWFLVAFAATGPLFFLRTFQVLVLTPALGARRPTSAEADLIEPLWHEILRLNDVPDDHYVVRVIASDELNAFACGGHLVVVTTFALDELSVPELQGVLAHELSHHLGLHTVALTIGHWLSLPVVALARIGVFLEHVAIAARDSFGRDSRLVDVVTNGAAMVIRALSWVFTFGIRASTALSNLVGHGSEFDADRRAVRMGVGRELAAALRRVLASSSSPRPVGWRARLDASHPSARLRVARIEALLRHPAN